MVHIRAVFTIENKKKSTSIHTRIEKTRKGGREFWHLKTKITCDVNVDARGRKPSAPAWLFSEKVSEKNDESKEERNRKMKKRNASGGDLIKRSRVAEGVTRAGIAIPQREPAALISPDNLAHPQRRCCTRIRRGRQLCEGQGRPRVQSMHDTAAAAAPLALAAVTMETISWPIATENSRERERERETEREKEGAKFCRHAEAASAVESVSLSRWECAAQRKARNLGPHPTDDEGEKEGRDVTWQWRARRHVSISRLSPLFFPACGRKIGQEAGAPLSSPPSSNPLSRLVVNELRPDFSIEKLDSSVVVVVVIVGDGWIRDLASWNARKVKHAERTEWKRVKWWISPCGWLRRSDVTTTKRWLRNDRANPPELARTRSGLICVHPGANGPGATRTRRGKIRARRWNKRIGGSYVSQGNRSQGRTRGGHGNEALCKVGMNGD